MTQQLFNIYCDESCHLESDNASIMTIAAVWCPAEAMRRISKEIYKIKSKHSISKYFEIKWTKVSPGQSKFYLDLVDYFFNEQDLHFRGIVIDKNILNHSQFCQSHDDWYYKMFFLLLKEIIDPLCSYNIYLDIKDTRSEVKRTKLEEYLRNAKYDACGKIINRTQQIRSHESQIMQFTDLFAGALRYYNERLNGSKAKLELIEKTKQYSRKSLLQTTWPKESKFNILIWQPGGGKH